MKRMIGATCVVLVILSACVPPPVGPSHDFVVSYIALDATFGGGLFTSVQGTITNTGPMPANYTVEVTASSGEIASGHAIEVLAGETAIWATTSTGNVTVASVGVMSTPTTASTVPAVAAITSQRTDFFPDFGLGTEIRGIVTNTGPTPRSFTVELQANTGEVLTSSIADVPASQSATWVALAFHGAVTARIVRVATLHPPP